MKLDQTCKILRSLPIGVKFLLRETAAAAENKGKNLEKNGELAEKDDIFQAFSGPFPAIFRALSANLPGSERLKEGKEGSANKKEREDTGGMVDVSYWYLSAYGKAKLQLIDGNRYTTRANPVKTAAKPI